MTSRFGGPLAPITPSFRFMGCSRPPERSNDVRVRSNKIARDRKKTKYGGKRRYRREVQMA